MIKREIKIFIFIFLFLALSVHFNAWLMHPIKHIKLLSSSSLGVWHPIYLTFIIYSIIGILRLIILFFKNSKVN